MYPLQVPHFAGGLRQRQIEDAVLQHGRIGKKVCYGKIHSQDPGCPAGILLAFS